MLASTQAARMGQVDPSQDEASTSEASTEQAVPWRQHSSRARDTGILLADGDIGSEQHQMERKRAIEKFYKEKQKRRLLGAHQLLSRMAVRQTHLAVAECAPADWQDTKCMHAPRRVC